MPEIKFYLNYDEDLENILLRLTSLDPAGLDYRIKKKGLDKKVVEKILDIEDFLDQKQILDDYLEEVYKKIRPKLEKTEHQYEKIWQDKNDQFFQLATDLMGGFSWDYQRYYFLISAFYSMASWGGTNKLAVWYKRDPKKYYNLVAFQLLLSHFFETIDQVYKKRPVSDWHLWALAEISAHILVFKEEKMVSTFWPHMDSLVETSIVEDFKSGSYPQLAQPAEKVYSIYKQTDDYQTYVKKIISYIKKIDRNKLLKK
jgi:hypothetical protein